MKGLHFHSEVYHPSMDDELMGGASGKDQLKVATGYTKAQQFGVGAQGKGSWVEGHIKGHLESFDYKAIYQVYNVKTSKSSGWWVFKYQQSTSTDVLKKTFEDSKKVTLNYDMKFMLEGNDFGINQVYIYYGTIQIQDKTVTKQYVVTNDASASAADPQGNPYSGFKPVSKD